mgnify:CR=1 FL=1
MTGNELRRKVADIINAWDGATRGSAKHLEILPRTFSVSLPEELVKAVRACGEDTQAAREVGIEWAIHQAKELKAAEVPIIHFYTMGRTDNIRKIARNVF